MLFMVKNAGISLRHYIVSCVRVERIDGHVTVRRHLYYTDWLELLKHVIALRVSQAIFCKKSRKST